MVDFHQSHASSAIFAAHSGRIKAADEISDDGRLQIIRRSQHVGGEGRLNRYREILVHPVIVRGDHVSVTVSKFENRISQGAGDTEVRKRGTDRTHHDSGVKATLWAYNDATNQNIRIRPDKATRAQVTQLTFGDVRRIVQVIDFDQSHTGSTVIATDDGRIETGIQSL